MLKFLIVACVAVCLSFVGCGGSGDSWIEGKWIANLPGQNVEYDFRSNGEFFNRGLAGTLLGKEIEEDEAAVYKGKWTLDGDILTFVEDGKEPMVAIVTRNDKGFTMQVTGTPITLSFTRP